MDSPRTDLQAELEAGREAYERRAWKDAHAALSAADGMGELATADLWRLGLSAYLIGREDDFDDALERAHQAHLEADEPVDAARCAFWLGFEAANRDEMARATGWFGRAARLLDGAERDCAERGYLLLPEGQQQLLAGDFDASYRTAADAARIGQRFGDRDLLALALFLEGRALIGQAKVEDGLARLDEAMVAVATDELSPQVTGLVYCAVIGACRAVHAVRRAHEWTAALNDWCERQPDIVAYTGQCRVYRAEILQLRGAWAEAIREARRASERLASGPDPRATGLAFYQEAEVHRLMGEFAAAEDAYRSASRAGREPQPGLALLRLAQGDDDAAAAAIHQALAGTPDRLQRTRLLPACVEIMLAVGEIEEARRACDELAETARGCAPGVLDTTVAGARGAIHLAAGDAMAALAPLREAWQGWRALDAPYEAARIRVLLGLACRELGDEDTATLELDSARAEFERLGAAPDVARIRALSQPVAARARHGLTPRELEVLRLVATGGTNRAIASKLFISEKTVARHVANIFAKLGLSSRAAATAYAYEHELLEPPA